MRKSTEQTRIIWTNVSLTNGSFIPKDIDFIKIFHPLVQENAQCYSIIIKVYE